MFIGNLFWVIMGDALRLMENSILALIRANKNLREVYVPGIKVTYKKALPLIV